MSPFAFCDRILKYVGQAQAHNRTEHNRTQQNTTEHDFFSSNDDAVLFLSKRKEKKRKEKKKDGVRTIWGLKVGDQFLGSMQSGPEHASANKSEPAHLGPLFHRQFHSVNAIQWMRRTT